MRHSKIDLTMSLYTHTLRGQESEAIAKLPDLSLPSRKSQKALKTGTNNEDLALNDLAFYLALQGGKQCTTMDSSGQNGGINNSVTTGAESPRMGAKTAFLDEKRRGRDSNPGYGCKPVRRFSKPLP